jgi:ankyrin repeat protein
MHFFSSNENGILLKKNMNGWTALMYACYSDHDRIVQLLISWGVDIHDCNNVGETALMLAALNGNEKILGLVYKVKYKVCLQWSPNKPVSRAQKFCMWDILNKQNTHMKLGRISLQWGTAHTRFQGGNSCNEGNFIIL